MILLAVILHGIAIENILSPDFVSLRMLSYRLGHDLKDFDYKGHGWLGDEYDICYYKSTVNSQKISRTP